MQCIIFNAKNFKGAISHCSNHGRIWSRCLERINFLHLTDALLSSACISMVLPFLFFAGGMNSSHVISDLHILLDMQIQTDPKMTRQLF